MTALAAAGPLPLRDLELSRAPLGPQALDALLGGAFPALTSLSLRECGLGDEGASLTHLSASGNPCSLGAWKKLIDAPSLRGEVRKSLEESAKYLG